MSSPEKTPSLRCTHCHVVYTRDGFEALPLVKKLGGRVTYGHETHEYRVCSCGSHVLLVTKAHPSKHPSRPSFNPVAAFAGGNDGRR